MNLIKSLIKFMIPNDRCDRVGAEEVSGPVLENTGGPPGRSLQLKVCQ